MNDNPLIFIAESLALTALIAYMAPRIAFQLDLRRLNKSTVGAQGAAAYKPKHVISKQSAAAATESVKKALTKRTRDFGWIIRERAIPNGKNAVVQIEGFVPAAKIAEMTQASEISNLDFSPADAAAASLNAPALDIKIRVDIYERNDGTEIVWKYLPNNPADAAARKATLDPRFNPLLSHTNSQLLSQLNPSLVSV